MCVRELANGDVGVRRVTTITSTYLLDMDARRVKRTPASEAEAVVATDGDTTVVVPINALSGDGAWLRLHALTRCRLGQRMLLRLQHDTGRIAPLTSTHVQCIQRVRADTDASEAPETE